MEVKGRFIFKDNIKKVDKLLKILQYLIKYIIKGTYYMSFNNIYRY